MSQNSPPDNQQPTAPETRLNLRVELDRLDGALSDLKVRYEQYFTGTIHLPPDKQHTEVRNIIKTLRRAPFRNSEMKYRLNMLEQRYNTLNTYWQRVLREREEGTYSKDLFKAALRERTLQEQQYASTAKGMAEQRMRVLYNSYRSALEQQTGKRHDIDFEAFQRSIVKRAKEFKEKNANAKLSFKVVVKEGKVSVQAKARVGNNAE